MNLAQTVISFTPELASAVTLFDNQIVLGAFLFAVTAGAIGLCVPGLLMPISFSAGVLMDNWLAIPIVAGGAALGSQALFLVARNGFGQSLERRFAGQTDRFMPHLEQYGLVYTAGLRMVGTPHILVTLASVAGRMRHSSFALASLVGFLPAVAMAAGAGSAF